MRPILFALLFICFVAPVMAQPITQQYANAVTNAKDSIWFYQGNGRDSLIHKYTIARANTNGYSFTLNVYDTILALLTNYQTIIPYTTENTANKVTTFAGADNIHYASALATLNLVNTSIPAAGWGLLNYLKVDSSLLLSQAHFSAFWAMLGSNAFTSTAYYAASNPSGYISSYTETDPFFTASAAHGITSGNIANWNTAYNKYTASGTYAAGIITFTRNDATTWTVTGLPTNNGTVTSVVAGSGLNGGTITNTGTISMPNVGTSGTYGDATHIPSITTDAQGRISGVVTYTFTSGGGTGTVTSVTAGAGLSGGTITTSGTISMPNIGTAGMYGSAMAVPVITVDAQGRVSNVSAVTNEGTTLVDTTLLTQSIIQNSFSSPVVLVPTPPTGYYIVVENITIAFTPVTTPYTMASTINILEGSNIICQVTQTIFTATVFTVTNFIQSTGTSQATSSRTLTINTALTFQSTVANPTSGDGTAVVKVFFHLVHI